MATNPSKKFCDGEEQKNGVVAGRGCGLKDIWFGFYCSKNTDMAPEQGAFASPKHLGICRKGPLKTYSIIARILKKIPR